MLKTPGYTNARYGHERLVAHHSALLAERVISELPPALAPSAALSHEEGP